MSLSAAADKFLEKHGVAGTSNKVKFTSTCEYDRHCQKVLRDTYGCCNWPDVTTFDASRETSWCTTHNKHCCVRKKVSQRRDPVALWKMVVCAMSTGTYSLQRYVQ